MDLRKALSAALLFLIALSPLGISQDVPDDVVYTEVKKTLVNRNKGVLTCRFKGTPNAVYWKRGSDPENSPSIITWGYDNKYGPKYNDGSCDIDENYSLIIKNVTYEDEGRYICRVSSYKGILIHNYTDVTVTNIAVKTELSVLLQKGEVGVLPCEVKIHPRTVSWVRGYNETLVTMDLSRNVIERDEQGLFNITNEYSLVIYNVSVHHEHKYFCEVADYDTESTYRDVTLLNVFAYPREPFPFIKECPVTSSSSCTLHIQSDRTISCHVEGYYPDIELYFVHGSDKVETLEARIWNNSDGTLNKLIEIENDGFGETSLECVAIGLMGQDVSGSMTIHLIPDNERSRVAVAVAVVVPVTFASAIIVIAILVFKKRKTHFKRKYKRAPSLSEVKKPTQKGEYKRVPSLPEVRKPTQKDLISFVEIWMLVKYVRQQNISKDLAKVFAHLLDDEARSVTLQTHEDDYNELCKWKKGHNGTSQREDFFDACRNQGLEAALDQLKGYSDSTKEVTSDDLEHTLWHVGGNRRIIDLLEELDALPEQSESLHNKSKTDVIVEAMDVLKYWRDVNNTGNQEVMLSLALEKINSSPNHEDFFRIPDEKKRGLDKQEIKSLLSPKVTSRHCTVLVDAMMTLKEKHSLSLKLCDPKSKDVWIDDVIEKNGRDLSDSHQMIEDWWAEQNCSNYEKRCRLRRAADCRQGQDMQTLTVPREGHEDINDEDLDGTLNDGSLSRPKSKFIYKAELVDMALGLIMEDLRPFAHALGIKGTRFTSYKRAFHPSHLEFGTISLALQLANVFGSHYLKMGTRRSVCNILRNAGYQKAASRFMFASEPSYGELFAMEAALTQSGKRKVDVVHHKTVGEMKPAKKSNSKVGADTEQSTPGVAAQGDKPKVGMVEVGPPATEGQVQPAQEGNNIEAADMEQLPPGAATQDDKHKVDVVPHESTEEMELTMESNNNVAADTEQSSLGAANQGDKPKADKVEVGSPATDVKIKQAGEGDNIEAAYTEQSSSGAATQGDKHKVVVGSPSSTRYIKPEEQSDSNGCTVGEQPPSKGGTHGVESNDCVVSSEPNVVTKERKSAKESNDNLYFKMGHYTSGVADQDYETKGAVVSHKPAMPTGEPASDSNVSVEVESTYNDDVKGEEDITAEDHKTEIGTDSQATGTENKLKKKDKRWEKRQIPISNNKPEKLQVGLQDTTKSDATQSGTEVGQGSQETSEEKTPAKKSQGDRKNEILQCDIQETPRSEATLTTVDEEETQTDYVRDTEGRCRKSVDDLKRILGLTDADLPESSNNPVLTMFKIWKERICPELTDHRVVLAESLKEIGKPHLVRDLINGEYHSNKTSIEFIEDMLKGMSEIRRTSLESLLMKEDKKKWPKSSRGTAQAIYDWVADWTKGVKPTVAHHFRDAFLFTEKAKQHRDFNNKLVEHGFLDLAREIMNIEEYWLTT